MNLPQDFIGTDLSDSTIQIARRLNDHTWEFWEWVDEAYKFDSSYKEKTAEEKLKDLDSPFWRKEIINIYDYTINDIDDALSGYSYKRVGQFLLKVGDDFMSYEDSIMCICECLFETM